MCWHGILLSLPHYAKGHFLVTHCLSILFRTIREIRTFFGVKRKCKKECLLFAHIRHKITKRKKDRKKEVY